MWTTPASVPNSARRVNGDRPTRVDLWLPVNTLGDLSIKVFLGELAAKSPAPGGGASACVAGAIAAAQAEMVVAYSIGKRDLAEHQSRLESARRSLTNARTILLRLADEDAQAYASVNELQRLPDGDARRSAELPGALAASIQIPLAAMAACVDMLRLLESLTQMTNTRLHSDLVIAAILAEASARASHRNVIVNAPLVGEPLGPRALTEAAVMASTAQHCFAATRLACEKA